MYHEVLKEYALVTNLTCEPQIISVHAKHSISKMVANE